MPDAFKMKLFAVVSRSGLGNFFLPFVKCVQRIVMFFRSGLLETASMSHSLEHRELVLLLAFCHSHLLTIELDVSGAVLVGN